MQRRCADVREYGKGFDRHVWMVLDGISIDITADQFPGISEKVIVSRQSEWHDSLRLISEEPWALGGEDWLYQKHLEIETGESFRNCLLRYLLKR